MSMYACTYCGAEYTSPLSAAICSEEDYEQDAQTREWFSKYRDNRQ